MALDFFHYIKSCKLLGCGHVRLSDNVNKVNKETHVVDNSCPQFFLKITKVDLVTSSRPKS